MLYSNFELLNHKQLILVFGCDGQLGRALQIFLKDFKMPIIFLGRDDCDLTDETSIVEKLNYYQPKIIINAAAYTNVDKAESEHNLAFAINAKAPELMALYIAKVPDGIFIHYSTDYVFADTKKGPYLETDFVGPFGHLNVYGQSKLAGEMAIEKIFTLDHQRRCKGYSSNYARYFIVRTSWLYGDGDNFLRTMFHKAINGEKLKVVIDQVGVPTSAKWLAEISLQIPYSSVQSGIYHAVPDGETSIYNSVIFAMQAANDIGQEIDIDNIVQVKKIDFPLVAKRPYNSRLSNIKLKNILTKTNFSRGYPHWKDQIDEYVKNYLIKFFTI